MTRRLVTYVAVAYLLAVTIPVAAHATTNTAAQKSAATATKSTAASKGHTHHASTKAAAMPKVDLNSATAPELTALPGIDQTMADKIIADRPFKNSSQILSKGIVTKEEYTKIRSRITARQSTIESKSAQKAPGSTEGTTTK
jgi:competence protein ComEA